MHAFALLSVLLLTTADPMSKPLFRDEPTAELQPHSHILPEYPDTLLKIDRRLNTTDLYDCYQLYHPLGDYGPPVHTQQLLEHTFGNSYHQPKRLVYRAPDVQFNKVVLTLEADTAGHQYDRLGVLTLGGVEVWRTSTAEPGGRVIKFGHVKDVSKHLSLFQGNHELVFVLDNIVDEKYTGAIHTRLIATFYDQPGAVPRLVSDQWRDRGLAPSSITPLTLNGGRPWVYPSDDMSFGLDVLPRNTTRVGIEIMASGNSHEEFWFSTLANKSTEYLNLDQDNNGHPTRVVEVYLNDKLAGQLLPQPVIYSGGISPFMWTPIVGVHAFDIPHVYIDLTPYLPDLWYHDNTIKLHVTNGHGARVSNNDWLVSASLVSWEMPGVVGDGHVLYGDDRKTGYTRAAPHFAHHREHMWHHDADVLHQGTGFAKQLMKRAHLVFVHANGRMEAFETTWQQSLMAHNFMKLDDMGTPRQIAHFQSQADFLQAKNLRTNAMFRVHDHVHEGPLHITFSTRGFDHRARILHKSTSWDHAESTAHYQVANSTMQHSRDGVKSGRGMTQHAVVHNTGQDLLYMRHAAARDGATVFDGRWLDTSDGGAPQRMARFISSFESLKTMIVEQAKNVPDKL